jgi:CheY-like chemotaxis protein
MSTGESFGSADGNRADAGRETTPSSAPEETVVLVAEDDADMAELYCQTLGMFGLLVVIAEDGERAVKLADEIVPAAICLDIRMPRVDGLSALERLRRGERTSGIPAIMVSNFDEPEMMERASRLGAVRYLVKAETPPAQLAEVVLDVLQLPERRKPGRLPISLGAHPAHAAEQMINAYRDLIQTTSNILSELGPEADEQRRQLTGYASQFRAQLAYWHAVLQRADEITQKARGEVLRPD